MRRSLSTQEKVDLVEEYFLVPYRQSQKWRDEHGGYMNVMSSSRWACLYGDFGKGLVLRDSSRMSFRDGGRYDEVVQALYAEQVTARGADHRGHELLDVALPQQDPAPG